MTARRLAKLALLFVALGDVAYRALFIYPRTDRTGRFAVFVEEHHIYRWLAPVVAGETGPIDVFVAGNSHVLDGVDCRILNEETGLRCYNLGLYSLPAQNAVELLFEFGHYPRLLLIDFATRYSTYVHDDTVIDRAHRAVDAGRAYRAAYEAVDRFQWLLPSLFVPWAFRPLTLRAIQKTLKVLRTGRMSIGRYTPFQPWVSYQWRFDKHTNHRIARRVRPRSRWEVESEAHLIDVTIEETAGLCDVEGAAYKQGMHSTETMVRRLLGKGVQVVFMRMPMDPRIVTHEDTHYSTFFQDVSVMAARLDIDYIDLTSAEHSRAVGDLQFYSDGQHILYPSDVSISRYITKLIRARMETTPIGGAA